MTVLQLIQKIEELEKRSEADSDGLIELFKKAEKDSCPFPPRSEIQPPAPITIDGKLYLRCPDRVRWFRMYCAHYGIKGRIDTERFDRQKEGDRGNYSEKVKATIYMDGEIVACGHGSADFASCDAKGYKVLETAETLAIGRALANAGFNIEGTGAEDGDMEGKEGTVADAPIEPAQPVSGAVVPAQSAFGAVAPSVPAPVQPPQSVCQPKMENPDMAEAMRKDPPKTLQEAVLVRMPNGKHAGKTLGEINATDRRCLEWIAGRGRNPYESANRFPRLVAAATLILDNT